MLSVVSKLLAGKTTNAEGRHATAATIAGPTRENLSYSARMIPLRWVGVAGLLLLAAWGWLWPPPVLPPWPALAVAAAIAAYNAVFALAGPSRTRAGSSRDGALGAQEPVQLWADLLAVAALATAAGGLYGPLPLAFIPPILALSLSSPRRPALAYAALALLLSIAATILWSALGADWGLAPSANAHLGHAIAAALVLAAALLSTVHLAGAAVHPARRPAVTAQADRPRTPAQAWPGASAPVRITHELRAPAAAIKSLLDVVIQGYSPNPQEMIEMARDRAVDLLDLIVELPLLNRLQQESLGNELEEVYLDRLVEEVVTSARPRALRRSVEVNLHPVEGLPPVPAHAEYLRHLLGHLMDNAVRYTEAGGRVDINLRAEPRAVICTVADTGIGIAAADLDRVFQQGFRAENARQMQRTGTGLGLFIAQQIVELHGGTILAESEPGKGCRFTFSLPTNRSTPSDASAAAPDTETPSVSA